jgi:hypothetical protein
VDRSARDELPEGSALIQPLTRLVRRRAAADSSALQLNG